MQLGMIGLGKMGANMTRRMGRDGHDIVAHDVSAETVDKLAAELDNITPAHNLAEVIASLATPRVIWLMVPHQYVDDSIDALLSAGLAAGDLVVDGGNSNYNDTIRRTKWVESEGLYYIGTGVSGGEEGARTGPSIMPGGSPAAWEHVKPIFQAIAAKTDDGEPCCDWVGRGGAGHFVKMVHNGIEYGDMQMICETYQMMKEGLGMSNDEMFDAFARWNEGVLDSYLVEITRDILGYRDENGEATLDYILDTAGQKGTGKWTGIAALEAGQPLTAIAEAVFARCLSAIKEERVAASKILTGPEMNFEGDKASFINDLEQALYVSEALPQTGRVMVKDEDLCVHCSLCAERCPTGAWDMQKSTVLIPYAVDEASDADAKTSVA